MSVKRRDLIRYLEEHGFHLLREGGNHAIYTNDLKTIPVKRHKLLDQIRQFLRLIEKYNITLEDV